MGYDGWLELNFCCIQTHQMVSLFQNPILWHLSVLDRRCVFHLLIMTLWNWQSDFHTRFTLLSEEGAAFSTSFMFMALFTVWNPNQHCQYISGQICSGEKKSPLVISVFKLYCYETWSDCKPRSWCSVCYVPLHLNTLKLLQEFGTTVTVGCIWPALAAATASAILLRTATRMLGPFIAKIM